MKSLGSANELNGFETAQREKEKKRKKKQRKIETLEGRDIKITCPKTGGSQMNFEKQKVAGSS